MQVDSGQQDRHLQDADCNQEHHRDAHRFIILAESP
jgi:hypothetical protein